MSISISLQVFSWTNKFCGVANYIKQIHIILSSQKKAFKHFMKA